MDINNLFNQMESKLRKLSCKFKVTSDVFVVDNRLYVSRCFASLGFTSGLDDGTDGGKVLQEPILIWYELQACPSVNPDYHPIMVQDP